MIKILENVSPKNNSDLRRHHLYILTFCILLLSLILIPFQRVDAKPKPKKAKISSEWKQLKQVVITDPRLGCPGVLVGIPQNWRVEGMGIQWQTHAPVLQNFSACSPNGKQSVDYIMVMGERSFIQWVLSQSRVNISGDMPLSESEMKQSLLPSMLATDGGVSPQLIKTKVTPVPAPYSGYAMSAYYKYMKENKPYHVIYVAIDACIPAYGFDQLIVFAAAAPQSSMNYQQLDYMARKFQLNLKQAPHYHESVLAYQNQTMRNMNQNYQRQAYSAPPATTSTPTGANSVQESHNNANTTTSNVLDGWRRTILLKKLVIDPNTGETHEVDDN